MVLLVVVGHFLEMLITIFKLLWLKARQNAQVFESISQINWQLLVYLEYKGLIHIAYRFVDEVWDTLNTYMVLSLVLIFNVTFRVSSCIEVWWWRFFVYIAKLLTELILHFLDQTLVFQDVIGEYFLDELFPQMVHLSLGGWLLLSQLLQELQRAIPVSILQIVPILEDIDHAALVECRQFGVWPGGELLGWQIEDGEILAYLEYLSDTWQHPLIAYDTIGFQWQQTVR